MRNNGYRLEQMYNPNVSVKEIRQSIKTFMRNNGYRLEQMYNQNVSVKGIRQSIKNHFVFIYQK